MTEPEPTMTDEATGPFGPYDSEAATRDTPLDAEVRRLRAETGPHQPGVVVGAEVRAVTMRHLTATCEQAGVTLGAYDRGVLEWLSDMGTAANQVLVGIISRAHAAGLEEGGRWAPPTPPWQQLPDDDARLLVDRNTHYE